MARYTGPVCKLCRREGMKLLLKGSRCLSDKCAVNRRPKPPGQHGDKRPRKPTEYGLQLREKQKMRKVYGILERQFRKHFEEAARRTGPTGDILLQVLEMRLDNVIYRLGFGDSRPQSRQLVRHGHFNVNGRKTDIPSYICKAGDVITVVDSSRNKEYFKLIGEQLAKQRTQEWLSLDARQLSARIISVPARDQIDTQVEVQLIVEYYSR